MLGLHYSPTFVIFRLALPFLDVQMSIGYCYSVCAGSKLIATFVTNILAEIHWLKYLTVVQHVIVRIIPKNKTPAIINELHSFFYKNQ